MPSDAELRKCPEGFGCIDRVMTNLDHSIEPDAEERLKAGSVFGHHTAWDFCGDVWFEDGQFHEEVWRYHRHVDTKSAPSLAELMEAVSAEWGRG